MLCSLITNPPPAICHLPLPASIDRSNNTIRSVSRLRAALTMNIVHINVGMQIQSCILMYFFSSLHA